MEENLGLVHEYFNEYLIECTKSEDEPVCLYGYLTDGIDNQLTNEQARDTIINYANRIYDETNIKE